MLKKIQGFLGVILGIVIAVGPYTFLHVCSGGMGSMGDSAGGMDAMDAMEGGASMAMPCQNVPPAALATGLIIAVISLVIVILSFRKIEKKPLDIGLGALLIILGIITIGIPTFIVGVCEAEHMHCHAVTRPGLIVLGILTAVAGVIGFFAKREKEIEE